ncbi:MAG: type II secretion system protein [Candidatus Omnitrophota bacterium]
MSLIKKILKCRKRKKEQGFTLTEIIVSMGIYSVVIGSLFSMLISYNRISQQCFAKWDVKRLAGKGMNSIVKEVRVGSGLNTTLYDRPLDQAGVLIDASDAKSIVFQVPVDWDADGDSLDNFGRVEWGAENNLDWQIEYCWDAVAEEILRRVWDETSTLVEQTVVANDISNFSIIGYSYDTGLKKYVVDTTIELIEINITAEKDTIKGRTLDNPLTVVLNNRVCWRN